MLNFGGEILYGSSSYDQRFSNRANFAGRRCRPRKRIGAGWFVSTFASSNSGLVSINTPLQETFALDHLDPNAPGSLRSLAERVGRDLVSNAQALSRHGAFERESWTSKAAIALRVLTVRPFSRLRDLADA